MFFDMVMAGWLCSFSTGLYWIEIEGGCIRKMIITVCFDHRGPVSGLEPVEKKSPGETLNLSCHHDRNAGILVRSLVGSKSRCWWDPCLGIGMVEKPLLVRPMSWTIPVNMPFLVRPMLSNGIGQKAVFGETQIVRMIGQKPLWWDPLFYVRPLIFHAVWIRNL